MLLKKLRHAPFGLSFQSSSRQYSAETAKKEASLYIHWPYCARRCTYCNFNKYIKRTKDDSVDERMKICLLKELENSLEYTGVGKIRSIFFGGGTPSLMRPHVVEAIVSRARDLASVNSDLEVTLEANPSDLSEERLESLIEAGVNRLSVGFQALNEQDLQILNRDHDLETGLQAIERCIKHLSAKAENEPKLKSLSVDLIFGRPNQSVQDWLDELQTFRSKFPEVPHLSLYQLTLERGTQLWKDVARGRFTLPDDDVMADLYDATVRSLELSNFHRYEVSNFSKSEQDESVHNWNYWTGGDYIGIGPGAHSRFWPKETQAGFREAQIRTLEPEPWMFEVEKFGHGTRKIDRLTTPKEILSELLATSLRTRVGVSDATWRRVWANMFNFKVVQFKETPFPVLSLIENDEKCQNLYSDGIFEIDAVKNDFKLTRKGLNLLDFTLPYLINSLESLLQSFQNKSQIS